jgi:NADH-quinone oxidoreductase subunit L
MTGLTTIAIIILLLPLLSFVVQMFFGRKRLPRQGDVVATGIVGVSFLLSLYVCFSVLTTYDPNFKDVWKFTWIDFGNVPNFGHLEIKMGILVDNLVAVMLFVVTGISFLVHVFSIGYMSGEPRYNRYFGFLGIFTFSMLGIVLSNNLFSIYIFWELVGLSSYLLIGFYYERDSATQAQKKAFLANRVGDIGMFIGMMILYSQFRTFDYQEIYTHIGNGDFHLSNGWLTAAGILLFCGCVGKSAQFPLHIWLPDAMEGPTPVSALIHAATMVAAGVYLVARIFVILTPDALQVIAIVGAVTAFMAATIAMTQNDIKRVLAYSTVSQLGYMVMGMGVGAYGPAFFHLVTHAFFKACLFLGSGAVIHSAHHEQDMRYMGGLKDKMPWTFATFTVAMLALAGIPLFSGFMSKDAILANALGFAQVSGGGAWYIIPIFGFSAAALTAFYMGRQVWMVFFGENRAALKPATAGDAHGHDAHDSHDAKGHDAHGHDSHDSHGGGIHEVAWVMRAPLVVLATLSVFFWFSFNPLDADNGWFLKLFRTPETVVKVHGEPNAEQPHAAMPQTASVVTPATIQEKATEPKAETHATETHAAEAHAGEAAHGEHHGSYTNERQNELEHAAHANHWVAVGLSVPIALAGLLLAYWVYGKKGLDVHKVAASIKPVYEFSLNKWYFDEIYDMTAIAGTMSLMRFLAWFDRTVIDGIVNGVAAFWKWAAFTNGSFDKLVVDGLVNLVGYVTEIFGLVFRKFQTGRVQTYVFLLLVAVVAYFATKLF